MMCDQKKRVAIIISSMNLGGAEKSAAILSRLLSKKGYDVYIFIDNHSGGTAYPYKGKIVWISKIETGNQKINYHYRASYLKQLKKNLKIDVSISFMEDYNFINMMADIGDKKIVSVRTHLSSRKAEAPEIDRLFHKMIPQLYNKANNVIVMTEAQAEDMMLNYGVQADRICIIPNIIDRKRGKELKKTVSKLPADSIITIGRLVDVKAQWHSIRAMSAVVEKIPGAHLYLLGNGENYEVLKELVNALHLEKHIHFEGFVADVGCYLKQAKLLVHTSKAEGFVNAVLDAFMESVPVVCTDVLSSPREIIAPGTTYNGNLDKAEYAEYGILVPPPDAVRNNFQKTLSKSEMVLAEVLIKLLSDEELLQHYQKKSYERAHFFSEENVISGWIACIEGQQDVR